jgi:hypothetical protein
LNVGVVCLADMNQKWSVIDSLGVVLANPISNFVEYRPLVEVQRDYFLWVYFMNYVQGTDNSLLYGNVK